MDGGRDKARGEEHGPLEFKNSPPQRVDFYNSLKFNSSFFLLSSNLSSSLNSFLSGDLDLIGTMREFHEFPH